ncbi:vesicle-associated membrane protein 724-like [Curcuma longa]|uniref:vesicle-associated membrane protein 724-like n=1 Tax=Curcuma longa TaxID=136217 RepID=UPI003D9DB824
MAAEQGKEGWFIYGFVARGTVVLAEYTEYTGNFPAIAAQCLQKLPSSDKVSTYACDGHAFIFLVHSGYAYCVVTKDTVTRNVSIAFLERLKTDFIKRYGGGKADTATAKSLNKDFSPVIKEHMRYIIDHLDEIDKLIKVKVQVSEVKNVMLENINKTMERGEKLNDLQDKATDLHKEAQGFRKQGTKLRKRMWLQNMKIKLVVLAILLILVLIIWVSVCHGFNCTKQNN